MGQDPLPPPPEIPIEHSNAPAQDDKAFLKRDGPVPSWIDRICSWWCNGMNPMGYSTVMKQRGFVAYAYMSPKMARYIGRRFLMALCFFIPVMGLSLSLGLAYGQGLDSPDWLLWATVPFIVIWMITWYLFSYCVFGRILRFERPSRTYGYTWPYTFELGFMFMVLLFLLFCWFAVLYPCAGQTYSAIILVYTFFLVIAVAMIANIVTKDPAAGCDLSASPVPTGKAQHQWCIFCSARAKIDLDGPWKQLERSTGVAVQNCYYPHPRRRHCQSCQKCVNGFDHHCYYLNTCISDSNYKQFVVMLTSLFCMIAMQWIFGVLVLVNHYDHDAAKGHFDGALNNQDHVMNDVWGKNLFLAIVFIMIAVGAYALWFIGDLLYLHYYFIYRSWGQPRRYSTLDYLHEQRLRKLHIDQEAARMEHAGNPNALKRALDNLQDFYEYNRTNYLYHDDIDMTGNNTEDLNVQHGSTPEHVQHLEGEYEGLHCFKAIGLERCCLWLQKCSINAAGIDSASDEAEYYHDASANNTAGDDAQNNNTQDWRQTVTGIETDPDAVQGMYRDLRASMISGGSLAAPPSYNQATPNEDSTTPEHVEVNVGDPNRLSGSFSMFNSEGSGMRMVHFRDKGGDINVRTGQNPQSERKDPQGGDVNAQDNRTSQSERKDPLNGSSVLYH